MTTPDDALTTALAITDLMLISDSDEAEAQAREDYLTLRDLIYGRKIGTDTREGMLINNVLDLADAHFDL